MINLDDVQDGIKELERAVRLGLSGAMITRWCCGEGAEIGDLRTTHKSSRAP